jgi:hypothetical protein
LKDYRAPLQINLAGFFFQLWNSFVEGVSSIFSSVSLFLGVLFEFFVPMIFCLALLFWPFRLRLAPLPSGFCARSRCSVNDFALVTLAA